MVRVCRPGGRVAVVDVYVTSAEQAAAYDQVERLRDPSHVSALALDRLQGMFAEQRLADVRTIFYRLEMDLEELLASSCPQAGAQERIRAIFAADLAENRLGMNAQLVAGRIRFSFPVAIVRGVK